MFWKAKGPKMDLRELDVDLSQPIVHKGSDAADKAMREIIQYGNNRCDEPQRVRLAAKLGVILNVEYDRIASLRIFGLMNLSEIEKLKNAGIDLQLHTHRHVFPKEQHESIREIADNRSVLELAGCAELRHFCYPSGVWCEENWPTLQSMKIRSAVTCDPGLNDQSTPRYALRRYLDGENKSQLEFEAEVSGFQEIVCRIRSLVRSGCRQATRPHGPVGGCVAKLQ